MSKISAEVRGVCRNFYLIQKVLKTCFELQKFKEFSIQTVGLKKKKI